MGVAFPLRFACLAAALAMALAGCKLSINNRGDDGGSKALPVYRVQLLDIQLQGKDVTSSVAFAINDRSELIGTLETNGGRHAYRWSAAGTTDLGAFVEDGSEGIAYDINDQSTVVGSAKVNGVRNAFVWQSGSVTRLPTLAGVAYAEAYGNNDLGDTVGVSGAAEAPLAVLWRNRQATALKLLHASAPVSEAYAINNSQVIVGGSGTPKGYAAVMWPSPETAIDLGRLPDAREEFGLALAVSRLNHVVGITSSRGGRHAFYWKSGQMTDLGDLPGGGDLSIAYGVNDYGHVVGSSQVKDGNGDSLSAMYPALLHHAFFWTQASGMVDLNSLIDPADPLKNRVTLLETAGISNSGRIMGRALVDGKIRAYVLTPVKYPV